MPRIKTVPRHFRDRQNDCTMQTALEQGDEQYNNNKSETNKQIGLDDLQKFRPVLPVTPLPHCFVLLQSAASVAHNMTLVALTRSTSAPLTASHSSSPTIVSPSNDSSTHNNTYQSPVKASTDESSEKSSDSVMQHSPSSPIEPPSIPRLTSILSASVDDDNISVLKTREREREMITCSICNKALRRGSMREHLDRHNNSGRFKCHICAKTFSRASAREKHVRMHTGERPFRCEYCSKTYKQKVHLNEHLRSHTGSRPYVCRLCGFSLASKSLLNRHLHTHGITQHVNEVSDMWIKSTGPTELVAAEVGRVALTIDDYHITASDSVVGRFANGRKFLCNACPAGFPTIQALRSHQTTSHQMTHPHKCPTCSETFGSIKAVKRHLRTSHPQLGTGDICM